MQANSRGYFRTFRTTAAAQRLSTSGRSRMKPPKSNRWIMPGQQRLPSVQPGSAGGLGENMTNSLTLGDNAA